MKKTLLIFASACCLASCGTVNTLTPQKEIPTPDAAAADSIIRAAYSPQAFASFVKGEKSESRIYAFMPHADSAQVRVVTMAPDKDGKWNTESNVVFPSGQEMMRLVAVDSCRAYSIAGADFISYNVLREQEGRVCRTVNVFIPEQDSHKSLSFTGKRLQDGRIEGESDETLMTDMDRPEMKWASARLHADPQLVFISKEDLMTDQAIEWWLSKNPSAQLKATRINIGQIDPECSLVTAFQKASKENPSDFRAAKFDIRGYTVVVSYRKSTGAYSLVWAEPVCTDRKNGRLLNSIYFDKGNNLALFYYKGKTTFKYIIGLQNGSITRR